MTRLITFTDKSMTIAAEICRASALANGCDTATIYQPHDIDSDFMWENREILSQKRGAGYWLWKPWAIDKTLNKMKDGDYLVYADAGVELVAPINHITNRMLGDIWLFGNQYQHVHWCKADVMKSLNCWDSGAQVQASVIIIRKTPKSGQFVNEWLTWCTVSGMIDDSPSKCPNHPELQEHRHDQAILTTLAYREKLTPFHWWPGMYNAGHFTYEKTGYTDTYPVLFHHHRMRNADFAATDDLGRHMQKYFKSKYSFVK